MLPLPQNLSWGVGCTPPLQFLADSFLNREGGGEDYDPQIFRPSYGPVPARTKTAPKIYSPPLFFDINILEPENIRLKFSFQSIYQPRSVNATTLAN